MWAYDATLEPPVPRPGPYEAQSALHPMRKERRMRTKFWLAAAMLAGCALPGRAWAGGVFFFSTGDPDGKIATLSRTASAGKIETETADDFLTTAPVSITSATFTGLLVGGATPADVQNVEIELY